MKKKRKPAAERERNTTRSIRRASPNWKRRFARFAWAKWTPWSSAAPIGDQVFTLAGCGAPVPDSGGNDR